MVQFSTTQRSTTLIRAHIEPAADRMRAAAEQNGAIGEQRGLIIMPIGGHVSGGGEGPRGRVICLREWPGKPAAGNQDGSIRQQCAGGPAYARCHCPCAREQRGRSIVRLGGSAEVVALLHVESYQDVAVGE